MDYFISDTHFDDKNILIYSRPEFRNVDEFNDIIIKNWNNVINENDTIWHLGDVGNPKYLNKLKGNIIIIAGNHDDIKNIQNECPNIKIYDKSIINKWMILSHEPISFLPKELPYLNIHGHLHQFDYRNGTSKNWYDGNRYYNVSCEKINYTLISITDIINDIGYEKI